MRLLRRRKLREPQGDAEVRALHAWTCGTPRTAMCILAEAGYGYTQRIDFLRHVTDCREDLDYWAEHHPL